MGLVSVIAVGLLLFWQPQANATPAETLVVQPATTIKVELSPTERAYLDALEPITVAPDPDWIPYERIDEQGKFVGIAADMFDLLAERLDIEFAYVITRDWDQAIELSKAGEVDLLPFLNQTPAREEWLIFTEPLLVDPNVFITRQEHPYIFDATQLSDTTIVLPSGTSVEERVRRDFPNLTVVTVPSENEVFQAVSNREADLTLRSLTIAAYTIRKEGLFNLKIAGQAPDSYVNRLRIGVLKDERMLRDILDKGIATITPRER
ncbi:MAG: transporter substrate-binding domain-containing protein, partial [Chloroflexia bacterium]|nr:transporter substrate-binding domain-containing protein [Chloroflexia bacterium]